MGRRQQAHTLRVAGVAKLCDDAVAVTFDVPAHLAGEFSFLPGQSLTLRRTIDGRDERRSYSICAPAGAAPRIGVREVPGGVFSTWLVHEVAAGDEIEVFPPAGSFTPDLDEPALHVMIAAGSGITPILSIVSSVLRDPASRAVLLYGNRRTDTVMFADEVADLKDVYAARFELIHLLSREPRDVDLFSGRLDAGKLGALLGTLIPVDEVGHWWLCGPFGMVTDAQELLAKASVPKRQIHQELFYVDDVPPAPVEHKDPEVEGPSSAVTLTLEGRSTTLQLPRDTPVLDGAQKQRSDLPFACKGGVCGTCRARLTHGEVHMRRNFALEEDELDAGFVLTCQSLPVSAALTVDYDA